MFSTGFAFLKNVTASGGGYDPDAEAYFTQVLAVGGSLTTPEKNAVNQLVLDFKAAGIYNKFDIFLPVLGNTAASSKINLVEPSNATYDWDYLGTPTFSSTGILGNGTDAVVRSIWKINNLVKSQIGDSHWAVYQKYNFNANGFYVNGTLDTDAGYIKFGLGVWDALSGMYGGIYQDQFSFGGLTGADAQGLVYMEAENSSLASYYIANSLITSNTNTQSAFSANAGNALLGLYWPGFNANNIYSEYSTNEIRSFSVGSYLSSGQRTAYYNAVQTYQTALGRQV
jgi:hypothetical protein